MPAEIHTDGTATLERPQIELATQPPIHESIYTNDNLIKALQAFLKKYHENPTAVYYPGSNIDISPSMVFNGENQKVVYVDNDSNVVKKLKESGHTALQADVTKKDFNPGEADLIILENAPTPNFDYLKKGGYVVAQKGWNDNVTPIFDDHHDLELVGVYDLSRNTIISSDLGDYKTPIPKDEASLQQHYKKEGNYYIFKKKNPEEGHGDEKATHAHDSHEKHGGHESDHGHSDSHGGHDEHGHDSHDEKKPNIFKRAWQKIKNFFNFSFVTGNAASELYEKKKQDKEAHEAKSTGHH